MNTNAFGDEHMISARVSSSCSNSGNHYLILVTIPMIDHEWGKKDGIVECASNIYIPHEH
jgi:hypothetical protein